MPLLLPLLLSSLLGCSDDGQPPAADGPIHHDAGVHHDAAADAQLPDAQLPDAWICPTYAAAASAGKVTTAVINETSGLAASAQNPGVLWLHNDSGDSPRVFAISAAAKLLGEYALQGAKAVDWEDMALGPGPTAKTSYLYLADIGDNAAQHASITVYRVAEPTVSATQTPVKVTLSGVDALPFVYPDGAHDAETLLIDPQTGDLYIVAKSAANPAGIYVSTAPQQPKTQRTLTKLGTVSYWATGGDIAADRSEVLLRSYGGAHLWHWPVGSTLAAALAVPPCKVNAAFEPQGEAIAFEPQTKDYFTLSEWTNQLLYRYVRK
jgi:hypothetical protein